MSNDLVSDSIKVRKPDQGRCQWVEGKFTGIAKDEVERTHLIGIPHLMPGTIIFVHGVNSEGEWYQDASEQFAVGLKTRLGRDDLEGFVDSKNKRFPTTNKNQKRVHSPIIPFYWGYCVPPSERQHVIGEDSIPVDKYGNPLRKDGSWGGGPFQNGTNNLLPFWQPTGFRKDILFGIVNLDKVNPILGRTLFDCPDRRYFTHAARRLAHLVKTIRQDLPNEPINIVAHSQGTLIALCSLFYLDGVRGPDTVILNSSPYNFDTQITDYLTAANGVMNVQREDSRVQTFAHAAEIVQKAKTSYRYDPAPDAPCSYKLDEDRKRDVIHIQQPPANPDWQPEIGAADIDETGRKWWQDPKRARDNRGKLFVNFNPADRVIGIAAIEGIGWRGIASKYLGEGKNVLGPNVMQRIFARGSNPDHNPPVGAKTNYKQSYFFMQLDRQPVVSGDQQTTWTTGSGGTLQTENENWHYLDGDAANTQWRIASEPLPFTQAHGNLSPRGPGGEAEFVWINAPIVPLPAALGDDFDAELVRYDGQADPARGIKANKEQQEDFQDDVDYQSRHEIACQPQEIECTDDKGFKSKRFETEKEVQIRRREEVGGRAISPTNHATILRYAPAKFGSPVAQVLSYDLTVGLGYAWGDEDYWNYLLDLADWKVSDPYFGPDTPGVLSEKIGDLPPGVEAGAVNLHPQTGTARPARRGPLEDQSQ